MKPLLLPLTLVFAQVAVSQDSSLIRTEPLESLTIRSDDARRNFSFLPDSAAFGFSSAATDSILAVGAPKDPGINGDSASSGTVFVYEKALDGTWLPFQPDILDPSLQFKLYPSSSSSGDEFGHSVSLIKDQLGDHILVVGAPGKSHALYNVGDAGTAYVFRLSAGSRCWVEEQVLSLPAKYFNWDQPSADADDPDSCPTCDPPLSQIVQPWFEYHDLSSSDSWDGFYPTGQVPMGEIVSIPGERYGTSVSITDGMIAIGAPNRDEYAWDGCDTDGDGRYWETFAQPPFNCDPACCVNIFGARQSGAAFVWYWDSSTLSWRLPNTNVVRDKDGIVVRQDEPDLEEEDDFFLDMRNGMFKSKDTVELGGIAAEFGEFGFSVSISTDREEEDPEDRVTVLSVASRQDRGGSGGIRWFHLYAPGEFTLSDFDLIYDPYIENTYPEGFGQAPLWAGQIGYSLDTLPLPSSPNSFHFTVAGVPGNGGEGEAIVFARRNGLVFVDRLSRLWSENGFFPDLVGPPPYSLTNEEILEGFEAWSPWKENIVNFYGGYEPMKFGTSVRFAGNLGNDPAEEPADFILVGAPGLTGAQEDRDPDDLDFDELPDPDDLQYAMGAAFVYKLDNDNFGSPFGTLYDRIGLVRPPEDNRADRFYRRLGGHLARRDLRPENPKTSDDEVTVFLSELAVPRQNLSPASALARPGRIRILESEIDDLEDPSDSEDSLTQLIEIPDEFKINSSGFAESLSSSADGTWLAVGSPFVSVPLPTNSGITSPFVQSENGFVYIAPGGIAASGQVRIYKKIDSPNDISGQEEWDLVQVINSPTISDDFSPSGSCIVSQRNVFRERFGFDVSLSEDGLVLLVGAPGGGQRPFFEDASANNSVGIAYLFSRDSVNSNFRCERIFDFPMNFGAQQGTSVDIGTTSGNYHLISGSPFYNRNGFRNYGAVVSDWFNLNNPSLLLRNEQPERIIDQEFGTDVSSSKRQTGVAVDLFSSSTGMGTIDFSSPLAFYSGHVSELLQLPRNGTPDNSDLDDIGEPPLFLDFGRSLDSVRGYLACGANGGVLVRKNGVVKYVLPPQTYELGSLGFPIPTDDALLESGSSTSASSRQPTSEFGCSVDISHSGSGALLVGDSRASAMFGYEFQALDATDCEDPVFAESFDDPSSWIRTGPLAPNVLSSTRFGSRVSLTGRSTYRYAISASNINSITNDEFPEDCDLDLQYFPRREVRVFGMTANPNAGSIDCNGNGIDDICEIESNSALDCINSNSVIDACEDLSDCNSNCIDDTAEINLGLSPDEDGNGIPDDCDPPDGGGGGGGNLPRVVINEFLLKYPDNFDGNRTRKVEEGLLDEQFIEVLNDSEIPVDMTKWELQDQFENTLHIFGDITIPPDCSVTVFGGGKICDLLFGGSLIETSSEGQLDLDVQEGAIRLVRNNGGVADRIEYSFIGDTQFRGRARIPSGSSIIEDLTTDRFTPGFDDLGEPFTGCANDECAELSDDDCDNNGIPDECEINCFPYIDCDKNGVIDVCELKGNDCNQNEKLDICECLADLNQDGIVDFEDQVVLLSRWGDQCDSCQEDLNCDGEVGFLDLNILLNRFGPCP